MKRNFIEAFNKLRELSCGHWDKFNTNEEIQEEIRGDKKSLMENLNVLDKKDVDAFFDSMDDDFKEQHLNS